MVHKGRSLQTEYQRSLLAITGAADEGGGDWQGFNSHLSSSLLLPLKKVCWAFAVALSLIPLCFVFIDSLQLCGDSHSHWPLLFMFRNCPKTPEAIKNMRIIYFKYFLYWVPIHIPLTQLSTTFFFFFPLTQLSTTCGL